MGLCDACCAGWVGGVSCTDVHLLGQQVLALSGIGSYKSVGGHIALSVLQHWSVTGDFNNHDLFDVSGFSTVSYLTDVTGVLSWKQTAFQVSLFLLSLVVC